MSYEKLKKNHCMQKRKLVAAEKSTIIYLNGNFTFSVLPILQLVRISSILVFNSLLIEICKLTFMAIFVFLGVLPFVRILLILLALIIVQRSTQFLEILSLCLYDEVSLMLEKLCIQWMKLSHISDNHKSHTYCT